MARSWFTGRHDESVAGDSNVLNESYDEYAALLDAVRGIRWPARSAVRGGIPGAHTSRLRGISAEFTEYRPYRQGDDPRRIDWKLFARSDRAYIRLSNDRAILPTRRSVTYEIIRAVSSIEPSGTAPLSPSLSIAAQSGGRLVIVTDFLGDAADLLATASRWVAAGREVHAIHVVAREELNPSRESAMVADPEAAEIRRPMIGEARDGYLEAFGRWRDELAHDWSDAGISYTMAVTGEETPDHLIRRIAAVRSGAAIA